MGRRLERTVLNPRWWVAAPLMVCVIAPIAAVEVLYDALMPLFRRASRAILNWVNP